MTTDEKGIAGFKKADFATPERVFGGDVRLEMIPEGVRLYLKEQSIDIRTKKVLVNVYRLEDDGGLKNKKIWVGRILNHKPEADEIADRFGGGQFIWILKWEDFDGSEKGIISEPIEIDLESGRAAHEAWKKSQRGAESIPASPIAPPAPSGGLSTDAVMLLKMMEAGEEKELARMERYAKIFGNSKAEGPAEVLQGAYKGASEMMMQAVQMTMGMHKATGKKMIKEMTAPPVQDEEQNEPGADLEGPQFPAWIQAFMPHIEKGIGKLLEGGPVGAAVKTLVLTSDEWQEIFSDKEKWATAVAAMEQRFGTENTTKALDILLNRKKGKGKA